MKLVGYMLRSDLKTSSNTKYIVRKAYGRLWLLRRLKKLGANQSELLDVLRKQVLSGLTLAVPYWNSLLPKKEVIQLERVLKTSLRIALGHKYQSFKGALLESKMLSLEAQRKQMVEKFPKWH